VQRAGWRLPLHHAGLRQRPLPGVGVRLWRQSDRHRPRRSAGPSGRPGPKAAGDVLTAGAGRPRQTLLQNRYKPSERPHKRALFFLVWSLRWGQLLALSAACGGEGQNGEESKTAPHKYTKLYPSTPKIPSRVSGAKRAGKIGSKEKKAKTKNL